MYGPAVFVACGPCRFSFSGQGPLHFVPVFGVAWNAGALDLQASIGFVAIDVYAVSRNAASTMLCSIEKTHAAKR